MHLIHIERSKNRERERGKKAHIDRKKVKCKELQVRERYSMTIHKNENGPWTCQASSDERKKSKGGKVNHSNKEKTRREMNIDKARESERQKKMTSRKTTRVRMTRKSRRLSYFVSFVIALYHTMSAHRLNTKFQIHLFLFFGSSIKNVNLWLGLKPECIRVVVDKIANSIENYNIFWIMLE